MGIVTVAVVVLALAALVVGPFLGQGRQLADLLGLGGAFSFAWDVLRLPAVVVGFVAWPRSGQPDPPGWGSRPRGCCRRCRMCSLWC